MFNSKRQGAHLKIIIAQAGHHSVMHGDHAIALPPPLGGLLVARMAMLVQAAQNGMLKGRLLEGAARDSPAAGGPSVTAGAVSMRPRHCTPDEGPQAAGATHTAQC